MSGYGNGGGGDRASGKPAYEVLLNALQGKGGPVLPLLMFLAVLFLGLIVLLAATADSVPARGRVLGPAGDAAGFVRILAENRVFLARDPYPAPDRLEPGEEVRLLEGDSGTVSVGTGFSVVSVPSDDAVAAAEARADAERRRAADEMERAPWAVREGDWAAE